ncbi:hypothetical protein ACGF1Z_08095 [Streptomyces sp. NPDC048018]|uniref:hypothetical protein n=1 Tax=Streptomyces sp. NPDC048018 TaxID=3365499 RepID=UPI0037194AC1
MGASRLDGPPRHARPLALASAVATLLGALFLCLGVGHPGTAHSGERARHTTADGLTGAAPTGRTDAADPGRADAARAGRTGTERSGRVSGRPGPVAAASADRYVCPYERGGCSLFPSLSPAVLSAPPLDPPLHAEGGVPRLTAPDLSGRAPRPGARPRAPDLHVLQVLRT